MYAPLLDQRINAQNTNLFGPGDAPAGSVVRYDVRDVSTLAIQILSNTLSGSMTLQGSIDGKNWVNLGGSVLLNQAAQSFSTVIPAGTTGLFSANVAEFNFVRLSGPGSAVTGEARLHLNGGGEISIVAIENRVSTESSENSPTFTQAKRAATANAPVAFVPSTTSQQIASGNSVRRGLLIVNRSGQEVFLRHGPTAATTTLFSWVLANGEKYEMPFDFVGAVQMIAAAAGSAPGVLVTEFVN